MSYKVSHRLSHVTWSTGQMEDHLDNILNKFISMAVAQAVVPQERDSKFDGDSETIS